MSQSETRGEAGELRLDFDSMPDYVKSDIAAAAWDAVQRFMQRPDAQAILDAERELLILEGSTLLEPRTKVCQSAKPAGECVSYA